jgi:phosphate transport system permease protein
MSSTSLSGPEALRRDHLRRRKAVNRLLEALATLAALAAVAVLVVLVVSVVRRGASALNLDLFTKAPMPFSFSNEPTGIANAVLGTIELVAVATAMALPVGILTAIYVGEFAPRWLGRSVALALDVLNGVPAIVIGIFVFALIVLSHGQSGLAGSFALAIIMLPLIARSTMEVLALVPASTREASLALGVPRWRTVVSVVLPQTIGGIVTGATLAVARAAGETAPLLFVSSLAGTQVETDIRQPLQSIPVTIFEYSESPDPKDHAQAWAAALVLMAFVLITSVCARALAARYRRRMGLTR